MAEPVLLPQNEGSIHPDYISSGGLIGKHTQIEQEYQNLFKLPPRTIDVSYNNIIDRSKMRSFHNKMLALGFEKYYVRNRYVGGKAKFVGFIHHEYKILADEYGIVFNNLESLKPISEFSKKIASLYRDLYFKKKITEKMFSLILQDTRGFYLSTHKTKEIDIDVDKHYNDDFKEVYENICSGLVDKNNKSLFIFRSEPGYGKTYFIRHLTSKVKGDFVYMSPTLLTQLDNPGFLPFAIDSLKNKILIIEDGEEILKKRNGMNSHVSTLLNLSDGLLKDVLNIKIIVTINCKTNDIDEALLRSGRIHTFYEFEKLHVSKCKALGFDVSEDTAICDLFNDKSITRLDHRNKLGF